MDEGTAGTGSRVPFTPVPPGALARLTPAERLAFTTAAGQVADGWTPLRMTVVTLVETIRRLISEPGELTAEGSGPLLDRACRDGECGTCPGGLCEHGCEHGCGHPGRPR